jgi:hypothetical protein
VGKPQGRTFVLRMWWIARGGRRRLYRVTRHTRQKYAERRARRFARHRQKVRYEIVELEVIPQPLTAEDIPACIKYQSFAVTRAEGFAFARWHELAFGKGHCPCPCPLPMRCWDQWHSMQTAVPVPVWKRDLYRAILQGNGKVARRGRTARRAHEPGPISDTTANTTLHVTLGSDASADHHSSLSGHITGCP